MASWKLVAQWSQAITIVKYKLLFLFPANQTLTMAHCEGLAVVLWVSFVYKRVFTESPLVDSETTASDYLTRNVTNDY